MTSRRHYLDHNATTPLRNEAREAMLAAMAVCGSASSPHAEGRAARSLVEAAREAVAALVGVAPEAVIFTSGASEANATALTRSWQRQGGPGRLDRCLVSALEHPSVIGGGRFGPAATEALPAGPDGVIDLGAADRRMAALREANEATLWSVMLANNETGVIQPVAALAEIAHRAEAVVHTDAAQAAGKIAIDAVALGADLVTLSSHKIGGPAGAGALVVVDRRLHLGDPLIPGGGQEKGARAGTENVVALAGFGAAARAALRDLDREAARQRALVAALEAGLRATSAGLVVFGDGRERLPNTLCFAEEGVPAETALIAFDLEGVALSSGAACSSGRVRASHVLAAMGVDPGLARCALRISVGRTTTWDDIEAALGVWNRLRNRLHERRRVEAA